jgi:hypothetical protein
MFGLPANWMRELAYHQERPIIVKLAQSVDEAMAKRRPN